MSDLNDKQARFVAEYLIDLNATQAAIRAGYSERTAYSQGQRLLKHVEVAAAIQAGQRRLANRLEITAERVLQEWARIGFSDIRNAVKWGSRFVERPEAEEPSGEGLEPQAHGGALKRTRSGDDGTDGFYVTSIELLESGELDDHTAAAISEVAQTKEGVRIKFHDKVAALAKLGDHLGLAVKRTEVSGPGGGPIQTMDALAEMPKDRRDALRAAIRTAMEG